MFLTMYWFLIFISFFSFLQAKVELGVDRFFKEGYVETIKGKRIGIVTNQTGVDNQMRLTHERLQANAGEYQVVALFSPEHGFTGREYAAEKVKDRAMGEIPIYSLHGNTRRPTEKMLKGIDLLIYDIQDIGCRPYTYATTLFYVMEEAARRNIEVIVLDRPNPLGGLLVDGPMLQDSCRSFIGYINVPYCHGMTIGELARFFNEEYHVGCKLTVVGMRGWNRSMRFQDTGLLWIPTSPNVPEPETPLFLASTGLLGELGIVNIGVGYTLPFKVVGAPWIRAQEFAEKLNAQKLPGVLFSPFHYRPFYGSLKDVDCQGVMIHVTDFSTYRPLSVQYLLIGLLKSLYPQEVGERINSLDSEKKSLFCKANGNEEIFQLLKNEKHIAWRMIRYGEKERTAFLPVRQKYLLYP